MKRIKRIIFLFVTILLLSGCVKNNVTMKINKDKSMSIEVSILVKEDYKDTLTSSFKPSDLESRGFKVSTINKDDYSGYKITKRFSNIDELSNSNNETSDISNILESSFDYSKLFTKESGFLKDTYSAKYIFSLDKYQYADVNNNSPFDMELKFEVLLPTVPNENNANEKSSDSKYLSWKISDTIASDIRFSFNIYNMKNIFIVAGSGLLLLLIIIVIIIVNKKKRSKATLIYKEYDPSIENKLNKDEIIKDENVSNQTVEEASLVAVNTPSNLNEQNAIHTSQVVNTPSVATLPSTQTTVDDPNNSTGVQTSNTNNEMQTLSSLEFEIPEDELIKRQQEAKKEDKFEINPNTFNYNRRPDFVKQEEPNKFILENVESPVEEVKPVVDNIDKPQVISASAPLEPEINKPSFINVENKESTINNVVPNSINTQIDVPDAIALSDMNDNK